MTADEVLRLARTTGLLLEARGDTLHVEGPKGSLTPELRAELVRHKPTLLARLAPVTEVVSLQGGLVVPLPALLLALDLERRGFSMSLDQRRQFQIEPAAALTQTDLTGIDRWRLHLGAIVSYDAEGGEDAIMTREPSISPDLRTFIDRAVVPALLERFLRDQTAAAVPLPPSAAGELPKSVATV